MLLSLVADPGQVQQIDWLNLSDATNVVRIVGLLIPILTAVVTKHVASQGLKATVTTVLSALTAAVSVLVAADGHSFAWQAFVNAFVNTFIPAIALYYGFWKPTGLAGSVAAATKSFGLGPRPVLETSEKGEESPSSAAGYPEAGAVSLIALLAVAGLVLLLLGIFHVLANWAFVLGLILLALAVVLAVVDRPSRL